MDNTRNPNPEKPSASEDSFSILPENSDSEDTLKKKKLKGEILLLHEHLAEKAVIKKLSLLERIERYTKNVLIISGFFAAMLGLVKPGYDYFVSAGKHEEARFNKEMIDIIKSLSDTSYANKERGLNLLTYYNPELVIPFLLDEINTNPASDEAAKNKELGFPELKNSISKIWNQMDEESSWNLFSVNEKLKISKLILNYADNVFKQAVEEYEASNEKVLNYKRIENFLIIIEDLNLWKVNISGVRKAMNALRVDKMDASDKEVISGRIKTILDKCK